MSILKHQKANVKHLWNYLKLARLNYIPRSKDNYKRLCRVSNSTLFKLLDEIGFFQFHVTNIRREICCLHQIVAYLKLGWRLLLDGFSARAEELEVHHLDSSGGVNNHPEILCYVTPHENKLLKLIGKIIRPSLKQLHTVRRNFMVLWYATVDCTASRWKAAS